jgi:hypothetical protein
MESRSPVADVSFNASSMLFMPIEASSLRP